MLGQLPPDPASLFDKPYVVKSGPDPFDIDISKAQKLWLDPAGHRLLFARKNAGDLVQGGPSPARTETKPVGDRGRPPRQNPVRRSPRYSGQRLHPPHRKVTIENREITSELNPQIRFFVFDQQPNMERLTPVAPETPLPAAPPLRDAGRR